MARPKKERPNRPDGTYEVKIKVGEDMHGKSVRKSFYSSISKADARAKAEAYLRNQEIALITGERFADRSRTFESWAHEVLESLRGTVKDSSYNLTYRNSIQNHLIPYFGKASLSNIRQIDIQKYFTEKGKTHSLESLKKHKIALCKIFEFAEINGLISRNPCVGIKLKSDIKPIEKRIYTKEQCNMVLEYARTHRFGLGVHLMLCYGISRSELLGLMWTDVDFEKKTISIQRGVTDVQDASTGKMSVFIGEPKNDFRKRIIPISKQTADLLKNVPTSGYIISTKNGSVCSPRTWQRRHYDVFMDDMQSHYKSQGVEVLKLNPHELRHTRASIWVNDGENIFAVADVLGHSDLKMLRKRYAHSDPESTRKLLGIE